MIIVYEDELIKEDLEKAKQIIISGGTVIFPTETVYGLGANALDKNAVKKIFKAKGRPADNPLIVHIWDINQVKQIGKNIPDTFYKLAEKFWPGPLTMLVKRQDSIPDIVVAGLDSVGIRIPSHPIAFEFLKECNTPIAAPSANLSGKPSPTNVKHVIKDMEDKVDMIIDGGECDIGLESTVLDLTSEVPTILRPGGITYEELKEVLEKVDIDPHIYNTTKLTNTPKSPGMKYRHYAPNAKVLMFQGQTSKIVNNIIKKERELKLKGYKVGILATNQTKNKYDNAVSMGDREIPITIAKNLFKLFREYDEQNVDYILMEGINKNGIGMAIVNRMLRASEKEK